jgi:flagellar P-ring protein precursor FlgI
MRTFAVFFALSSLAPAQSPAPDVRVVPGGVEAPAQPATRSSARYERGARFQPQPAAGDPARTITTTVETLVDVRGQEDNQVTGLGIVTGLGGTGDSTNMTKQLLQNVLLANDVRIDVAQLTPKNCAIVSVEATLPPGIQPGRKLDVRVSTLGDAKSLQGGVLLFTELRDTRGTVWATAGGPVDVGGFLAEGAAGSVAKNHVTVGMVSGGGKVERYAPSDIVSEHGFIYLDLRAAQASFANLVRIVEQVNAIYPDAAEAATDGRTVKVRVPGDLPRSAHVAYLDSILSLEVAPQMQPYVVVNERTGAIVIGGGVRLRPGAVALGALTVSIAESPETSQPGPLSQGTTTTNPRTDIAVHESDNALVEVPGAVTLHEVVEVLNVLGTTPRDLIQILEAMHQAGLLLAEVRRM